MQDGVLKLLAEASAELGRVLHPGVCVSPLFSASWLVRYWESGSLRFKLRG